MDSDLLRNGLLLMVIGMGTVFSFLTIMVVCIQISAKFAAKFAHLLPEEEKKPRAKKKAAVKPQATEDEGVLLAVISAAVHKYRQGH
ncbi:MAG: OadG family protein [Victivallales bacterium]|jgi:oxaloacetate decarboxylase (Na+ extruding) subunit gamma|nr:OadG family protein [Victivallales bacterium]MBT7299409.1 OadG family protein [Victivallales bacterium]